MPCLCENEDCQNISDCDEDYCHECICKGKDEDEDTT